MVIDLSIPPEGQQPNAAEINKITITTLIKAPLKTQLNS